MVRRRPAARVDDPAFRSTLPHAAAPWRQESFFQRPRLHHHARPPQRTIIDAPPGISAKSRDSTPATPSALLQRPPRNTALRHRSEHLRKQGTQSKRITGCHRRLTSRYPIPHESTRPPLSTDRTTADTKGKNARHLRYPVRARHRRSINPDNLAEWLIHRVLTTCSPTRSPQQNSSSSVAGSASRGRPPAHFIVSAVAVGNAFQRHHHTIAVIAQALLSVAGSFRGQSTRPASAHASGSSPKGCNLNQPRMP